MTLVRWNPVRDLSDLQETMNRFFSSFPRQTEGSEDLNGGSFAPPVDVSESEAELVFTVELPGFEKDDVDISLENGLLTLSGERKFDEDNRNAYRRVERWYGKFFRSFRIPTAVDAEKISASLKNGVLTLRLPKKAEARPRQIPVSVQ